MELRARIYSGVVGAVLLVAAIVAGYALPYPERWDEGLLGMKRADAWRLLGVPDIEYSEKFDGWNRDALIGSWVLTIRFRDDEVITSVDRKFDWGLGYLAWDDDYRTQWRKGLTPRSRTDAR
jgi:hypothetical protein